MTSFLGADLAEEEFISFPYLKLSQCCGGIYLGSMALLRVGTLLATFFMVKEYYLADLNASRFYFMLDLHQGKPNQPTIHFSLIDHFNKSYHQLLPPFKHHLVKMNLLCWEQQISSEKQEVAPFLKGMKIPLSPILQKMVSYTKKK